MISPVRKGKSGEGFEETGVSAGSPRQNWKQATMAANQRLGRVTSKAERLKNAWAFHRARSGLTLWQRRENGTIQARRHPGHTRPRALAKEFGPHPVGVGKVLGGCELGKVPGPICGSDRLFKTTGTGGFGEKANAKIQA